MVFGETVVHLKLHIYNLSSPHCTVCAILLISRATFLLQKQRILCHLAPKLPVERIKQEAVRVAVRKAEEKAQKEFDERVKKEKEEAETQAVSVYSSTQALGTWPSYLMIFLSGMLAGTKMYARSSYSPRSPS